jgi:hypothetical protein
VVLKADCILELHREPKEKKNPGAGCRWLMPVILVTQEAEIRRIMAQSQPGKIVLNTLSQKNPSQK